MDLLNLQPHQISKDISSYTTMIYGGWKSGKSTFAHTLLGKDALFLAFEKGYTALSGVYAQDITSWADLYKLNAQLKKKEVKEKFKVLVIDTLDIMDKLALDYIKQTQGVDGLADIPFGKGYAMKDELIFDMLRNWQCMGYGLFFISHADSQDVEKLDENGQVRIVKSYMPTVNKRTLKIVAKMCDIIGFNYFAKNSDTGEEKRALFLRETEQYQAGSRFKYTPPVIKLSAEDFKIAIKEAIEKEEIENPNFVTDKKESSVINVEYDFDAIKKEIIELVKNYFNPNEAMEEVNKIVENHLGIGAKVMDCTEKQVQVCDIILTELKEKAKELNFI
ncbi:AAA family ATPase [Clostridium perfringens]|nr:AAA family ATPase [Clostridium perfringens]